MDKHEITPDHKSKDWLLYCLNQGYSQRQMGRMASVSAHTIRLWLKKHDIKWRSISESLLEQSDLVSQRAKKVWADPNKRAKQSKTMKKVQSTRKKELSESAEKNWRNNRDALVAGIRIATKNPNRNARRLQASKEDYLRRAQQKFGNRFNYENVNFTAWDSRIDITCNACGYDFSIRPLNHIRSGYCPSCGVSQGHQCIVKLLGEHEHVINDRTTIGPLELDVYIPSHKLAIEHHGIYWHSYDQPESVAEKHRHQDKWNKCNEQGIKLLQFFDFELQRNWDLIESMVLHAIGKTQHPYSARTLNLHQLTNKDVEPFFAHNHLANHRAAKITLALLDGNEIVSAMSFSKYRDGYEIIRYATKRNSLVRGGASRLLTNFVSMYSPKTIHTYADLRHSAGGVYSKLGFQQTGITKPGYFYYRGADILSRQRCQKRKLAALLEDHDPKLTEATNMFLNGYRRVWDAGHIKLKLEC